MSQPIPAFMEDYLDSLREKGRKESTIKRYQYDLIDFSEWHQKSIGPLSLEAWSALSYENITLFFDELIKVRSYKVRTTRRIYSVLQQLARFCLSNGQVLTHAILHYKQPELVDAPLSRNEWLNKSESDRLLTMIRSYEGLTENQMRGRPLLIDRNEFIAQLFLSYGCSLHEVASLTTADVRFERNQLRIRSEKGISRIVTLTEDHKRLAYTYLTLIPEPVRPRLFSNEPFFVAFDFQRETFRWSYEEDRPKRLTEISIQKMLRLEVMRASLRKGFSAMQLRHTFILRKLIDGADPFTIQQYLGLKSPLSLRRYFLTIDQLSTEEKLSLSETATEALNVSK
ncbi:tyrosine-type recombinase/integrase [Bacillus sp. FJAT-45037]|uniref:tyrosine-type recombinase/integrase n=1 Tax=Bacillus sp. FJAT-45037 TaxID=2011007 RepID=UPI000C2376EA|nr:site-specific integrase [Bacillus sp. FJAT-45037]